MPTPRRITIAGFGAGGLAVAETLRRSGWDGELTILAAEPCPPYDRPPLSKGFLAGSVDERGIELAGQEKLAGLRADVRWGTSAARLLVNERLVVDSGGERHAYDELVIATGVRARRLAAFEALGAHVLRTLADARALRAELQPGCRLAIIGAGFVGLEVAATATKLGLRVTVLELAAEPLADRLGAPLAGRLLRLHRERGVDLRTGVEVSEVDRRPAEAGAPGPWSLRDRAGRTVEADVVLVAAGSAPSTDWLVGTGLAGSEGLLCDRFCRAAPGVWGVGDVAAWDHQRLGSRIRVEHRTNAPDQGRAVAHNILGAAKPYIPVPFFWTDQYEARIQFAGSVPAGARMVPVVGGWDEPKLVATVNQGDRLWGCLNWNAPVEMMPWRRQLAGA